MSKVVVHKELWRNDKHHGWVVNAKGLCGNWIHWNGGGSKFAKKVTCKKCLKKLEGRNE